MANLIDDYFKDTVLKKLNYKAVETLIDNVKHQKNTDKNTINYNKNFFDSFFKSTNKKLTPFSSEELAEYVENNIDFIKKHSEKLNTEASLKGKRELPYKELKNIGIGDYISCREGKNFIQGTVKEILERKYLIENKNGTFKVDKDMSIKFFPGQKFDAREIGFNLIDMKINRTQKNEIDFKNIFNQFNLNKLFLTFSDLDKSNRLKLLKGQETGVITISLKYEQNGKFINKTEKIRLKAFKHEGKVKLQKISGFDIEKKQIYGRELTREQVEMLEKGKTIVLHNLLNKQSGKNFNVAVFYDKGLNLYRTKKLNEKPLEKLRVLGNYNLSAKELETLNTKGELILRHKNSAGKYFDYKITYDLPLNKTKITKLSQQTEDLRVFKKENIKQDESSKKTVKTRSEKSKQKNKNRKKI